MSFAERWLSRLQLSDSSQRLLTEALLDWKHEASASLTMRARMIAHVRSTIGLARLGIIVTAREVAELATSTWGWAFVGWFVVLTWLQFHRLSGVSTDPQALADAENITRLIGSMSRALSVAGFLTMVLAPSGRRAPLLALLTLALLASVATNYVFGPMGWEHLKSIGQSPYRSFQPWSQLFVTPLVAAAVIGVLTGDAIRRDARRWTALALATLAYLMIRALPNPVSVAFLLNDLHLIGDTVYLPVLPQWFTEFRFTAWPLPITGAFVAMTLWWRQGREAAGRQVSA